MERNTCATKINPGGKTPISNGTQQSFSPLAAPWSRVFRSMYLVHPDMLEGLCAFVRHQGDMQCILMRFTEDKQKTQNIPLTIFN